MLKNKLYLIENKNIVKDEIIYNIRQNKSNEIYKAHFPNFPVTPGACLIEIAKELCENHFEKQLKIKTIKSVKFINMINPVNHEYLLFHLSFFDFNLESFRVKVKITFDGNVFSKINFELSE